MKFEPHRAFAGSEVAAISATRAVGDVVIDDAVINERAVPIVIEASELALADLFTTLVGHAVRPVAALGDELIHRHRLQRGRACGTVGRHSVVNVTGEIRGRIVRIWSAHAVVQRVSYCDAVAKQCAVRFCRNGDRINSVTRNRIAACAVVVHGHSGPVCRQLEVRVQRASFAGDIISTRNI